MKFAKDKQLESAVYTWFLQQWTLGKPTSGSILCEKH